MLLTDATTPLGLAWRARQVRQQQARLNQAEARNREAVLHLLLAGGIAGARRAAAALGPVLPEVIRIHLVEHVGHRVNDALRWCVESAAGTAWIVRCPVYTRHIVVVARPDADDLLDALRSRAAEDPSYRVGSSQEATLDEFGSAYRHAFHALSVARHRPDRYAAFLARGELATILADVGAGWAERTLAPLLAHEPARLQDPDSEELMFTLASWLTFHGMATRHLKVHRNTLAARLQLVESLLKVDLGDVATQARLNLAVQLMGRSNAPLTTLDEMLSRPEVLAWAAEQRAQLSGSDPRLLDTLSSWLGHRANIRCTAAALGISASGVRKRIIRVEQLIQRSLLDSPSARYDLCLALLAVRNINQIGLPTTTTLVPRVQSAA
ncbi:MAG: helix-turn-helix domain-containing protein [Actinocatenispora sp.]